MSDEKGAAGSKLVSYSYRDGRLVLTTEVSLECDPAVWRRHELLAEAAGCYLSLEEKLLNLGEDYDPEYDAELTAHPYWEHFSDVQFAAVLFSEAVGDYCGPWGSPGELNYQYEWLPTTPEKLFEETREWAEAEPEDTNTWLAVAKAEPEDTNTWLAVAKAAVALDAKQVAALSEPIVNRWRKRDEEDES